MTAPANATPLEALIHAVRQHATVALGADVLEPEDVIASARRLLAACERAEDAASAGPRARIVGQITPPPPAIEASVPP